MCGEGKEEKETTRLSQPTPNTHTLHNHPLSSASYIFTNTARSAYGAASGTAATLDVAGEVLQGMDTLMRAVKDPAAAANPALAALNSTLTSLYNSVTPALKTAVAAGVESVARRMDDDGSAIPFDGNPLRDEAVFMTAASGARVRVCISSWCADLAAVPGARSVACVCRPAALAAVRRAAERAATGCVWAGGGLLLVAGGSALLFGHFAATAASVAAERDALYGRGTRVDRLVDAKARRRARAATAAAGLSPRSPRWPTTRPSLGRANSGDSATPTGGGGGGAFSFSRPASAFVGPPPLPLPPPARRGSGGSVV